MSDDGAVPGVPTRMDQFSAADWERIEAETHRENGAHAAAAVLGLLRSLTGMVEGYPVDQLTHACQTATRAERAGAPAELVVTALCHDVGKAVSDANHGSISAEILRPYVSDDAYQAVRHHQDFQLRHYAHYLGGDPDARQQYRGEPWYPLAARLSDEWDQVSFDPDYDTLALEHFEQVVREVFGRR